MPWVSKLAVRETGRQAGDNHTPAKAGKGGEMRMHIEFGGGSDAVFYDVARRDVVSYELAVREDVPEEDFFHRRYGGETYYRSRTGLSGAGWYESALAPYLVRFGWYRTDAGIYEQERRRVDASRPNNPLYGYLPIRSHKGVDRTAPAVLVTCEATVLESAPTVAFVPVHAVDEVIRDWAKVEEEAKSLQIPYYCLHDNCLERQSFEVRFWSRKCPFRGVNLVRFLDQALDPVRDAARRTEVCGNMVANLLHIYPIGSQWGHWNALGYCDQVWGQDPRDMVGPLAEGWYALGAGVFIRRCPGPDGLGVKVLCSISRPQDLRHADLYQWAESYQTISVWDLKGDPEEIRQQAISLALAKAREELERTIAWGCPKNNK
jgi:hypothetical protein